MTGLEVWNAVKKYLNLYHHQAVKENIDVETVEGMPINIIEKELKALEILMKKVVSTNGVQLLVRTEEIELTDEEKKILLEVLG